MKANFIAATVAALLAGTSASPTLLEQRQGGAAAVCSPSLKLPTHAVKRMRFANFIIQSGDGPFGPVVRPATPNPNPNPLAPLKTGKSH